MQRRFLPYVRGAGDSDAAEEAALFIGDDLEWLLTADTAELWAVARTDGSLMVMLDTYLRYAPRPYDEAFQASSEPELLLWTRTLALLHRL